MPGRNPVILKSQMYSRLLAFIVLLLSFNARAQILNQWTQLSLTGDASTHGESSAAIGMDDNYMFVGDNEHEVLRLFARYPTTSCPAPVYSFDASNYLSVASPNPEVDIESAVKADVQGTSVIYWLGSHSNSKSGNLRTNRFRLFATEVTGNGAGSPPYQLAYRGRYDHLRDDLITWDHDDLHGLGPNYFGLSASAASGVPDVNTNGFNIEGLCMGPDGTTAYIAFRAPLVNGIGPTTSPAQRTNALVVPLLNIADLVTNNPVAGPGRAKFGRPFTLNLGQRGIRSIDSAYPGHYLITAGPVGPTSEPPVAPLDFRLFTWTGDPADRPVERLTVIPDGYSPEGAVLPATPISSNTVVQFVSDDSTSCWRSFTAYVGEANVPGLELIQWDPAGTAWLNLLMHPTQQVEIEFSTDLAQWTSLTSVVSTNAITRFSDGSATNPARFYRVRY